MCCGVLLIYWRRTDKERKQERKGKERKGQLLDDMND